jgi:lipase maturation factor 1
MTDSPVPLPHDRPLMIYDGDCGFCRVAVERWRNATKAEIEYAPYQELKVPIPGANYDDFRHAVHFVDSNANIYRGAEAVFRAMAHCGRKRSLLRLYCSLPPFAFAAEAIYRTIAANRSRISAVLGFWRGKDLRPPTYFISTALYLRLMGIVYLIAFASLWGQADGLVGDHGILPTKDFLAAASNYCTHQVSPVSPIWTFPTLAWLNSHDGFLDVLCAGGMILSALLIFGILPILVLALLWVLYLSLFVVGQDFLSFQWDILLLEAGFLSIFIAPFGFRSKFLRDCHAPRIAIWLVWWLLFRLMFESGAVKLTWSNWQVDAAGAAASNTWRSLTALNYHYWTQPLPIWMSWYAAQLPEWFQKLSVVFVLVVELLFPWLIFGPRRCRYVAFCGITVLMLLIAATGNYNFFNLLTVVIAVTLLDDTAWPKRLQNRITGIDYPWLAAPTRWRSFLLIPFALFAMLVGLSQVREAAIPERANRSSLESRLGVAQFCWVNSYGLFRQMTETRPEIVIEGSNDALDWKPYEFRWKPGDLSRPPRLCAPYQPRLDWQMWFEALRFEQVQRASGTIEVGEMSFWFRSFLMRLATGEPQVLRLLDTNPFADKPPKFIRVVLYQYRFTTFDERRKTGNWWNRNLVWAGPAWSIAK